MSPYRLVALLVLCWAAAAPAATLVYSGNLDGELEPCGCTAEGDLGGILRRATMVRRLRAEAPGLVLVSSGGLFNPAGATDRITSAFILRGLARLGYDAIGVQWKDLAYGPGFLAGADLPWVASNWTGPDFARERRIRRPGLEIAFFQWLEPQGDPAAMGRLALETDPAPLRRAMARARSEGAMVVLAMTLPFEEARSRLPVALADVVIARAVHERYGEPRLLDGVLVLRPGSRGQRLGRLDFTWDPTRRLVRWRHTVIPLPASVPDDPGLADWYAAYTEALRADFRRRKALRERLRAGASPYAGAEACRACHADAYAVWSASDHARAYSDLEAVGKGFDANCVGCHSVGFGAEGGFVDMELTPELANVQCESCHGPARAHAADAGRTPTPMGDLRTDEVCARCHDRAHSPGFDPGRYWARILHGGAEAQASTARSRSSRASQTASSPGTKR